MRSALAVISTFLILASACSGDYGRATSPSTYPSPVTPRDSQPVTPPPATPPSIRSIAIAAADSILVVGDSVELSVIGLDTAGRQVATLRNVTVRPEPVFSAADGIVYLTATDSGVDVTLLWSHLNGHPIGAHIHRPVESDGVNGVLADIPIGDQFDGHGGIRGTLTASSIRARDGRGPISVDSLVTLIANRAIYVDIHSAERPAGEIRGTPFASGLTNAGQSLTSRAPVAAAASRTSRSLRSSRG